MLPSFFLLSVAEHASHVDPAGFVVPFEWQPVFQCVSELLVDELIGSGLVRSEGPYRAAVEKEVAVAPYTVVTDVLIK